MGIYRDGRHYDAKYKDFVDDVPFLYGQVLRYGDPVLELACGTGRITIPLARQGVRITGLDREEAMLAEARQKAREQDVAIEWVRADCRNFELRRRFKVIIFPFNSIAHLHDPASLEACLAGVKRHLEPEGRFLVDTFNPDLKLLLADAGAEALVKEYLDPDGRGRISVFETHVYDAAAQIQRIQWRHHWESGDEVIENLDLRIFFPQELDALLRGHGFILEAKYGNYDESPFTSSSPKQILVCRLR